MRKIIIICLFSVLGTSAYAFNSNDCKKSEYNYETALYCLFIDNKDNIALTNMNRLANSGDVRAMFALGISGLWNDYENRNFESSKRWLIKAADNGDMFSKSILAIINMEEEPSNNALEDIITIANKGEGFAQFYLGRLHAHGINGVAEDRRRAAYWLQRAAHQGISKAGEYLTWIYYSMDDKSLNNIEEAMIWYHFGYSEEFYCHDVCEIIHPIIKTLDCLIPNEMSLSATSKGSARGFRESPIAVQVRYTPNFDKKNIEYLKKNLRPENLHLYKALDIRDNNNVIISLTNRYM